VNEILWAVTRATALVSLVLLTATFVLGVVTSARTAASPATRTVITTVHRTLSLAMISFVAVHVVTAITETYVDIGWLSALVPFTSGYARGWIGLGTITVDLVLAVIITSLLRQRIPHRWWRLVHLATYAMWPIALLHGLGSVSTGTAVTYAVCAGCAAVGLTAVAVRLVQSPADTRRRRAVAGPGWRTEP
jgi:predicted ferric reductase